MGRNILSFFSFFIFSGMFCLQLQAQAELVNYEETWQKFLNEPLTSAVSKLTKPDKSNSSDYLKYCLMTATSYFCADNLREANEQMAEIKKIRAEEYSKIQGYKERYEDLDSKIAAYFKIGELWNNFLKDHNISLNDLESVPQGKMLCEKGALAKYFYMSAYAFYCNGNLAGTKTDFENKVLSLVEKANFDPKKVVGLPDEIKFMKEILRVNALLDKAWAQYLASDKSPGFTTDLEIVACYVIPNLKILVLRSMVDICKYGSENVKKIQALLKQNTQKIPSELQDKIDWLISNVNEYNGDEGELKKLWATFISNNDTIASAFTVAEKYCDKIIQVKSWCLLGYVNTCEQGQEYLIKIDAFTKEHNLKFDEELACRINRLRIKVWDCRYWELVEQAWAMTHAEREDFGPRSALVMHKDLNGPKQVCETKVEYEPLGKIGIKYTVKIFLCQNIDLAKMGDPDYYKKIAKWIDTEVLIKYCSSDYRCKEGFTIYIEGHTDGNPMALHKYKESFDIPKETPFTHYIGTKDTLEKVLEKDIKFDLRTNMELGLGRAWTIKKQLDFMKVPISIGAYEHPKENKGGEFRRMEVELFIPNLLLDFYEGKLKELLEASGIGPQPKQCKG